MRYMFVISSIHDYFLIFEIINVANNITTKHPTPISDLIKQAFIKFRKLPQTTSM